MGKLGVVVVVVIRYRQKLQAAESHLAVLSRCLSSQHSATALYILAISSSKKKNFFGQLLICTCLLEMRPTRYTISSTVFVLALGCYLGESL